MRIDPNMNQIYLKTSLYFELKYKHKYTKKQSLQTPNKTQNLYALRPSAIIVLAIIIIKQ